MAEHCEKDPAERRRFFTRVSAGVALLALAPGVRLVELANAKSDDEPASSNVRWGMYVDTTRCAKGCTECVDACNAEHGLRGFGRPETDAQWIRKLELEDEGTGQTWSLPMMCQHCESPPCVDVCPTGASFVRPDGIVLVDKHTCIGCRYCMMACPYKARSFIHEDLSGQRPHTPRGKGTVESCNFCAHRVDRGRPPACVEACAGAGHDALVFGDLNDAGSGVAASMASKQTTQVRDDLGLNTAVRYHGI